MALPTLADGTLVKAADHWNPLVGDVNAASSGLATESGTRAGADAAINTRLNSLISAGGISDLPTWKTTIDAAVSSYSSQLGALNTAVGIPYSNPASLATRVTTLESGTPVRPYLHAYQATAQAAVASGSVFSVIFDAETLDNINGHSTSVNPTRYTPSVAGRYECIGGIAYAPNTAGDRIAQFRKNSLQVVGDAPYGAMPAMNGASLAAGFAYAFATLQCNGTTDYIELWGQHNAGVSLATTVASSTTSFMIVKWVAA